jgi:tetratricopeptide (TPR) repeat protein
LSSPRAPRPVASARRRRAAFRSLLLLAPLLLVLLLEGAARLVWPDTELDPYLALAGRTSALTRRTVDGVDTFLFTHPHAYAKDSAVAFSVRKPAGTVRIMTVGGSANAGYPHRPPQRWTDYLERALARAFPDRRFEVVNLGAHACASYRLRMIFDDALAGDPDVVVIYSGNNEFVEKRSYLLDFPGKYLVEAVKRRSVLVSKLSQWWAARSSPDHVLSGNERTDANYHVWTHTERIASALRSDPEQFAGVKRHYRYSIEHMVRACVRRGIAVLVLTVPVNLRDWSPAVSTTSASGAAAAEFAARLKEGCANMLRGDPDAALAALDAAVQADPEHAEAHFQRAKALAQLGRSDDAYRAFTAALDCDRNPFRASSTLNDVLREVVAAHPRARLVDAVAAFRAAAADGLPGFDLMLDYVHPSRAGNLVLARIVYEALARDVLSPGSAGSEVPFHLDDDGYRDEDDDVVQLNLLALFGIMHQYEAYLDKAAAFERLLARRGHAPAPAVANVLANTTRAFRSYLDERRKEILGEPFDPGYRERHAEFYRQFFLFVSELKGALTEPDWTSQRAAGK